MARRLQVASKRRWAANEAAKLRIVVDRRENPPLYFHHIIPLTWGDLSVGRYSIDGYEEWAAADRFTLDALASGICGRRKQTWDRLHALAARRYRMVVVDALLSDVSQARYQCRADPSAVMGSVNAIQMDIGIPVVWAGSSIVAADMVVSFLRLAAARIMEEGKNDTGKDVQAGRGSGKSTEGVSGSGANAADGRQVRGHHGADGDNRGSAKTRKPPPRVCQEKRASGDGGDAGS